MERVTQLRAWLLVAASARQTFRALDATSANQATVKSGSSIFHSAMC